MKSLELAENQRDSLAFVYVNRVYSKSKTGPKDRTLMMRSSSIAFPSNDRHQFRNRHRRQHRHRW